MARIKIAKLSLDAKTPTRKNKTDAGVDVFSLGNYIVPQFSSGIIRTGITVDIPKDFVMLIKPKSKSDHLIGAGVVDSGYQGEILVKIVNYSSTPIKINDGDAVAQLVIVPVITPEIVMVSLSEVHKNKTDRGATGGIVSQLSLIESIE